MCNNIIYTENTDTDSGHIISQLLSSHTYCRVLSRSEGLVTLVTSQTVGVPILTQDNLTLSWVKGRGREGGRGGERERERERGKYVSSQMILV